MRRRIVLMTVLGVLVAGITAGVLEASTSAVKAPKVITVKMTDYHFALSPRGALKKGVAYKFKIMDKGQAPHNFDIQGLKASPIIGPGMTTSFKITFKKAGRFPYICDVPRHAALGMNGSLTVK